MITPAPSRYIGEPAQFTDRSSFDVYGAKEWYFKEPLTFYSAILQMQITVPAGFVFDFASIPRIARPLIPVAGRHRYPAGIHDWLYASLELELLEDIQLILATVKMENTRELADAIFHEANWATGVPQWKRYSMFSAVRVGGWKYYNPRIDELFATGMPPEPRMADLDNLPPINMRPV